jgi:hypothetical protein
MSMRRRTQALVHSGGGGLPQCGCDRRAAPGAGPRGRPDRAAGPFRPACLTKAGAVTQGRQSASPAFAHGVVTLLNTEARRANR